MIIVIEILSRIVLILYENVGGMKRFCVFRHSSLVLVALFFCFWVIPWTALAQGPVINRFESSAELTKNGVLEVTERITATMPGGGHGLRRDIPVVKKTSDGEIVTTFLEVQHIGMDGDVRPIDDVEQQGNGVFRIYIRNTSKIMTQGTHVFTVQYAMDNVVRQFDDHDELNWNVTGSDWSIPIEQAVYFLRLPEGAHISQMAAWLGAKGSRGQSVAMQLGRQEHGTASFKSQDVLQPGEGMTCAVAWQKGIILAQESTPEPESTEFIPEDTSPDMDYSFSFLPSFVGEFLWWLDSFGDTTVAILVVFFVWSYYAFIGWRLYRRSRKRTIIPLFHPPKAPASAGLPEGTPLSPAAVNYLMNGAFLESRGFVALLLSMAGRKSARIWGNKEEGFSVEAGQHDTPFPEEQNVLSNLNSDGALPLNAKGAERLYSLRKNSIGLLHESYPNLWVSHRGWLVLGIVMACLGVFGYLKWALYGAYWDDDLLGFIIPAYILCIWLPFIPNMMKGYRLYTRIKTLIGFCVLFFIAYYKLPLFLESVPRFDAILLGVALMSHWPVSFFTKTMTKEALNLRDECEGMALYIRTAETERFRHLNPPERTPKLYTELLPYAVALNLEKAWGENCADVLDKARLANYFYSDNALLFVSATMIDDIVQDTDQSVLQYYEANHASAFGDSGGDFSDDGGDGDGGGVDSGDGGGGGDCC